MRSAVGPKRFLDLMHCKFPSKLIVLVECVVVPVLGRFEIETCWFFRDRDSHLSHSCLESIVNK